MGDLWIPDACDWLEAYGVPSIMFTGALTRSRSSGGFDDILAIGPHHSASSPTRTGLRAAQAHFVEHVFRPVGNFSLDREGKWWFGAAGASNTQGKGGPYVCSRGVIPLDSGNRFFISVEAENNGVGEPWSDVMQLSYARGIAALIDGLANEGAWNARTKRYQKIVLDPLRDVVAHFEWTNRKIDPAGPSKWMRTNDRYMRWNMDGFRNDVASQTTHNPSPQPEGYDMILFDKPIRLPDVMLARGEQETIELPYGGDFKQVRMNVQVLPLSAEGGFVRFFQPGVKGAVHNDVGWVHGQTFAQQSGVDCNVIGGKIVIEHGPASSDITTTVARVIIDVKGYLPNAR